MVESAIRLGSAVAYRSAGTVEFLFDAHRDEFFFLEVIPGCRWSTALQRKSPA